MKVDATRSWFGGAKRLTGLTAKFAIHPHEARFWQLQCATGVSVSVDLPKSRQADIGIGTLLVVQNIGTGLDGALEFLDFADEPVVFADGSKQLDVSLWVKIFCRGFDGSGNPIWSIVRLPGGARAVLT